MKPVDIGIDGALLLDWEVHRDDRGSFARSWCVDEAAAFGIDPTVAQVNVSRNPTRGTLRGLHLQLPPLAEAKLIRCTRGTIFDVIVDIRRDSPTYLAWRGVTLGQDDDRALFAPAGVAHGFLTLEDDTEVTYQMSAKYDPALAIGVRYDDPAFGIEWPAEPTTVSARDLAFPPFEP